MSAAELEEHVGTRIIVWLGALALFLAGAFLVKYTFDAGLLTPAARIILGLLFGAVLLGVGEWFRQRSPRIAQGLTAAGVADLFACFLAAMNLYRLIEPTAGFACLAAANLAELGAPLPLCVALLTEAALDCGLTPTDTRRAIENGWASAQPGIRDVCAAFDAEVIAVQPAPADTSPNAGKGGAP